MRKHIVCKVGDGSNIFFWHDRWWGPEPLSKYIPNDSILQGGLDLKSKVKDMICNGQWYWPQDWHRTLSHIVSIPVPNITQGSKDVVLHSCTMWMAVQGRLNTQERLLKWYPGKKMVFQLCGGCPDLLNHLFFECNYSIKIWNDLKKASDQDSLPDRWEDIISTLTTQRHNKSIKSVLKRLTMAACVYYIWLERNRRIFTNDKKNNNVIAAEIFSHLRLKLVSLTVKRTTQVEEISKKWRVEMNSRDGCGTIMEAMNIEDI
ncbi:reverse transcriptase domain, reverse transcriptase zinc-binding domain protein [Tanacetum coccineum]